MIDKREWLPQAELLPLGRARRIPHACGDGVPMIIEHKLEGYRCYCHRCGEGGWHAKHVSLEERIAALTAAHKEDQYDRVELPSLEYSHAEWSPQARLFLYRAGMSEREAQGLGIGYHSGMQRVFLPIMAGQHLLYWQARGFDPERPKYINPRVDRSRIVAAFGVGETTVLVEDYLSAWKIGKAGDASAWALLGTSVPDPILAQLVSSRGRVVVWLDPDEAGQSKAGQLGRTLQLVGREYENIVSRCDPKLMQLEEIRDALNASSSSGSGRDGKRLDVPDLMG